MKSFVYIHPRAQNTNHIWAIRQECQSVIGLTKKPFKFFKLFFLTRRVLNIVLGANFDRVGIIILILALFRPHRYILQISDDRSNLIHKMCLKQLLKKGARIAFVTHHVKKRVSEMLALEPEVGGVVFHGSDVLQIWKDRLPPPVEARYYDVLFFGRLNGERGIFDFFEMARRLPEFRFAVAGKRFRQPDVVKIAASIKNLDYLGWIESPEEKVHLMSNSKLLFSGMKGTENFGISILEALKSGCMVSCPLDYGPLAILKSEGHPFLRPKHIPLDGVIKHVKGLIEAPIIVKFESDQFEFESIRSEWKNLMKEAKFG